MRAAAAGHADDGGRPVPPLAAASDIAPKPGRGEGTSATAVPAASDDTATLGPPGPGPDPGRAPAPDLSSTPPARPPRTPADFLRKLAAVLLVLGGVTVGIVGLGFASQGDWWGIVLIAATPLAIWAATRIAPEGGTTGYFDENI